MTDLSPLTFFGLALILLKLCNVISWPWLWVLAPFWLGIAFVAIIVTIALAIHISKD